MANQIIPTTVFALSNEIGEAHDTLKVGLSLMNEALQFRCGDEEQAMDAQERLYFIAQSLENLRDRLGVLAVAAHDMGVPEKAAA